jgi:hypothetical protein
MQHPNETLANIHRENEMKHLEHKLETYVYSYCNICNISIYFCNINMKHLQHSDETSKTLEIYSCNMGFAWTNGATPARRSMATHGPHCAAVAWATHRWTRRHTNLVPLVCLLKHPSWRFSSSVEAVAARRQRGGGGQGRLGPAGKPR